MKKYIFYLLIYFTSASSALFGMADYERILWDYNPIKLELTVGVERRIDLPANIQDIKIKQNLSKLLKSLDIDNRIFWLAKKPFSQSRILIIDDKNHQFIFDVSAVTATATKGKQKPPPLLVLINKKSKNRVSHKSDKTKEVPFFKKQLSYIDLTRFVAKETYAPERLRNSHYNINRVPLNKAVVYNLINGVSENSVPFNIKAEPLASWSSGNAFVTAVKLINQSKHKIILDPRYLKGRWLAATFQHHLLFPAGDGADNTVVYLISKRHFEESLR